MTTPNQLVEQIRVATDYQINKRELREKVQADLHLAYNSGLFKVTPALIAFVTAWDTEIMYLEDTYENPIEIKRDEFLLLCKSHYQTAMNAWHIEHEKLKRIRKI
jgi:hypothetical protein